MNRTANALIAAKLALGAGLALGLLAAPHGTVHAAPPGVDVYAWEVGDDNGDGVVMEDESGWSCVDMGDRRCGPGNSNGVPAGCYDDGA
jgi:hypothetical protein